MLLGHHKFSKLWETAPSLLPTTVTFASLIVSAPLLKINRPEETPSASKHFCHRNGTKMTRRTTSLTGHNLPTYTQNPELKPHEINPVIKTTNQHNYPSVYCLLLIFTIRIRNSLSYLEGNSVCNRPPVNLAEVKVCTQYK